MTGRKGTVLVTGGAKRLGKVIAEALRADGWRVLVSSHRADAGSDLVADLAEPSGPAKLYAAALAAAPDLCAIVNNAALFDGDDATLEAVNLVAPRKLTTLLAGREDGVSSVVNILDSRTLGPDGVARSVTRSAPAFTRCDDTSTRHPSARSAAAMTLPRRFTPPVTSTVPFEPAVIMPLACRGQSARASPWTSSS